MLGAGSATYSQCAMEEQDFERLGENDKPIWTVGRDGPRLPMRFGGPTEHRGRARPVGWSSSVDDLGCWPTGSPAPPLPADLTRSPPRPRPSARA